MKNPQQPKILLNPPLTPRNGKKLRALYALRVSDPRPGKQDVKSLTDQKTLLDDWLTPRSGFAVEVTVSEGRESGEWIEREDYLRLINLVESGEFDLVLTEDVGRIIRRIHVGSSRVDLQACKLEYSIVSPK